MGGSNGTRILLFAGASRRSKPGSALVILSFIDNLEKGPGGNQASEGWKEGELRSKPPATSPMDPSPASSEWKQARKLQSLI